MLPKAGNGESSKKGRFVRAMRDVYVLNIIGFKSSCSQNSRAPKQRNPIESKINNVLLF